MNTGQYNSVFNVNQLEVLSVPTKSLGMKGFEFDKQGDGAFRAESCARQLLIGPTGSLTHNVSPNIANRLLNAGRGDGNNSRYDLQKCVRSQTSLLMAGESAYAYFLSFACGLQSKKFGESHNVAMLKERWNEAAPQHNKLDFVRRILSAAYSDSKLIRAQILDPVKKSTTENAAIQLANINSESIVYVFADGNDTMPENLIYALKQKGSSAPREIIYVNTDRTMTESQYAAYKNRHRDIVSNSKFSRSNFEQFLSLESYKNVTVISCAPTNAISDYAAPLLRLIESSALKMFVQIRGDSQAHGASTGQWLKISSDNYASPEAVNDYRRAMLQENRDKFLISIRACTNCAYSRAHGIKIDKTNLALPLEDYLETIPAQTKLPTKP